MTDASNIGGIERKMNTDHQLLGSPVIEKYPIAYMMIGSIATSAPYHRFLIESHAPIAPIMPQNVANCPII